MRLIGIDPLRADGSLGLALGLFGYFERCAFHVSHLLSPRGLHQTQRQLDAIHIIPGFLHTIMFDHSPYFQHLFILLELPMHFIQLHNDPFNVRLKFLDRHVAGPLHASPHRC